MTAAVAASFSETLRNTLDKAGSGYMPRAFFEDVLLQSLPGLSRDELGRLFDGYGSSEVVDYERFVSWVFDASSTQGVSIWAGLPGFGDELFPGFGTSSTSPEQLPDLRNHFSPAAQILRGDQSIYSRLRTRTARCGASFARCVKPGIDDPRATGLGAVACDASCYEVFREFFEPLLRVCHPGFPQEAVREIHPVNRRPRFRDVHLERAATIKVCLSRNLQDYPFPPACNRQQREAVERFLRGALENIQEDDLAGRYRPLGVTQPRFGLSDVEGDELSQLGLLFGEPETTEQLAAGLGQHWPDGRGLFVANSRQLAAWVNYSEHLSLVSIETGRSIRQAFDRICRGLSSIELALGKSGNAFAHNEQLGFLTANPSELGTGGLRVVVSLKLPLLSAQPGFNKTCLDLGLSARQTGVSGLSEVANARVFGVAEAELVENVLKGCERLQALETELEGKR